MIDDMIKSSYVAVDRRTEVSVRSTSVVLYITGVSFLLVDALYLYWSLAADNFEVIGLITIGLSGIMCVMLGAYLQLVGRNVGAAGLPEDRLDADIDDGDPEIGFFSPWSWWPVTLAGVLAIVFLGLAISPWIVFLGVPLVVVSLVGWVYEYYRGAAAR